MTNQLYPPSGCGLRPRYLVEDVSAIERHPSFRNEAAGYGSERIGTATGPARSISIPRKWRMNMDREHVKGAADKVKGSIKEVAGKVTGDTKTQVEGDPDATAVAASRVW